MWIYRLVNPYSRQLLCISKVSGCNSQIYVQHINADHIKAIKDKCMGIYSYNTIRRNFLLVFSCLSLLYNWKLCLPPLRRYVVGLWNKCTAKSSPYHSSLSLCHVPLDSVWSLTPDVPENTWNKTNPFATLLNLTTNY